MKNNLAWLLILALTCVVTVFTVLKVLMFSLPTSEDPSNRPYPIFDHRISSSITLPLPSSEADLPWPI